jgi:hypothetical protein
LSSIHEGYTRELYDEFKYFACWLPNSRLALGDVGTIDGRRFERLTTLTELGVPFEVGESSVVGELEYSTSGLVDVSVSGDAQVGGQAAVAVSIMFTGRGATFFQAGGCVSTMLTGLPALEKRLLDLPDWRPGYAIVSELVRTGPAVILVSGEKGASVDLQVSADALTGAVPIANAGANLGLSGKSGFAARMAVTTGATPLFRAVRLRRPIVGRRRLRWRSSGAAPTSGAAQSALTSVTWDEFAGPA